MKYRISGHSLHTPGNPHHLHPLSSPTYHSLSLFSPRTFISAYLGPSEAHSNAFRTRSLACTEVLRSVPRLGSSSIIYSRVLFRTSGERERERERETQRLRVAKLVGTVATCPGILTSVNDVPSRGSDIAADTSDREAIDRGDRARANNFLGDGATVWYRERRDKRGET